MKMTEDRLRALTAQLGPAYVKDWADRPVSEQQRLSAELLSVVLPILEDLSMDFLADPARIMGLSFRADAELLFVRRFGQVMTYKNMAPEAIVQAVGDEAVDRIERYLKELVLISLQLLKPATGLDTLIPHMNSWDPDAELRLLLDND